MHMGWGPSITMTDEVMGKWMLQTGIAVGYYREEDKNWWNTTVASASSLTMWSTRFRGLVKSSLGASGKGILRGAWHLAKANPVTATITAAYLAGLGLSKWIDPEEGVDNYHGFMTGGLTGNAPNYWGGDQNNSGYFNMGLNLAVIMDANNQAQREFDMNYQMQHYKAAYQKEIDMITKIKSFQGKRPSVREGLRHAHSIGGLSYPWWMEEGGVTIYTMDGPYTYNSYRS